MARPVHVHDPGQDIVALTVGRVRGQVDVDSAGRRAVSRPCSYRHHHPGLVVTGATVQRVVTIATIEPSRRPHPSRVSLPALPVSTLEESSPTSVSLPEPPIRFSTACRSPAPRHLLVRLVRHRRTGRTASLPVVSKKKNVRRGPSTGCRSTVIESAERRRGRPRCSRGAVVEHEAADVVAFADLAVVGGAVVGDDDRRRCAAAVVRVGTRVALQASEPCGAEP